MTAIPVAVSQRVDLLPERGERRDALDQRLCQWLAAAGYLPVPTPNCLDLTALHSWLNATGSRAVVLSSGNDIGDCPERDATERHLLDWAKERRAPVLGICRGMQMMAVWAGGALKAVQGHVRTRHALRGAIVQQVNSYHNFALANCPSGFEVLATAEDGEIEAIRHAELPWQGWMWHPEREREFSPGDGARIKKLFGD